MIDTDKYKGHTKGPWEPYEIKNSRMWTIGNLSVVWKEADKNLVADAPLLLAEVKRLRELLDAIHWDAFAEDDTTLEIDREVAERIRRDD